MYNKELKIQFIRSYTTSIHTANIAERLFSATGKYETEWGSDLCTQSAVVLQPVIDEITGVRTYSQATSLTVLREYVKWCIAMKVPNACDGMLHITAAGLDKVKTRMVSSPLHLQRYLNEVFDEEYKETVDLIYRCYYWMAFAGLDENDILLITTSDIDFNNMRICYNGKEYPIYRESLMAFHAAVELPSFNYEHPNYPTVRRDRVEGDTILRGIRAATKTMAMRSTLSRRSAEAIKAGKTELHLSYHRVWLSGLFYRTYENERVGIPVSFAEAAVDFMSDKEYTINGINKGITLEHKQARIEKNYREDYARWKLAFPV